MMIAVIDELTTKLRSKDAEQQHNAIKLIGEIVSTCVREVVATLEHPATDPYVVALDLAQCGPVLVPALIDLFQRTTEYDVRTYSGLILLEHHCDLAVDHLLHALRSGHQPRGALAVQLSKRAVTAAKPVLEGLLLTWPTGEDPYMAATLIDSLGRFGPISDEIVKHFSGWNDSEVIRLAIIKRQQTGDCT